MNENTYILKGIVHPERAQISMGPIKFELHHLATGNNASVRLNVVLNQVTVLVQSQSDWDIFDLRNLAKQVVADHLAVVGYIKGYAYDVEIRQILNLAREVDYVYGIDIPCIEKRNKDKDLGSEITKIMAHLNDTEGIFVKRCLNDLAMSMKHPDDTAFYCFRALESLKQFCRVKFNLEEESKQWEKLSEITGFGKEDIKFIRDLAFPSRHGDVVSITSEDRKSVFLKTWDIVDAFLGNA